MVSDGTPPRWHKSTFSVQGDCVEWLAIKDSIYVRHSKQPRDAILVLPRVEWLIFIAEIKGGP